MTGDEADQTENDVADYIKYKRKVQLTETE